MSEQKCLEIGAALSTLMVFLCMTLPFFLGFVWLYVFRHAQIGPVILTGTPCALVVLWWRSFRLETDEKSISYRTLFGGTRRLSFGEIGDVLHEVDFRSRGFRPPIRLEVYALRNRSKPAFDINLKVFSLDDVARINEALAPFIAHRK